LLELLQRLRRARWANLCVINLRILIGFAFVPAALKKVLDQPFTDPANSGRFHDFLDAFHATGPFYQFVGVVQLAAALLLSTQRFALLGAFVALPVLTAITVFVWSTIGLTPTAVVASLMLLGIAGLLLWDLERWRGLISSAPAGVPEPSPVPLRPWMICGAVVWALYLGVCLAKGGVYRPRGMALHDPAFYALVAIGLSPFVTWFVTRRRSS
jgi:hypothetical protein